MADSSDVDFVITEIGGTVGDIESLPFLEAIRQFPVDVGRRRCMFIHLTLVPYISHAGELKTKPTQHSVNELRRIGIAPDMVICRSESSCRRRHPTQDRAVRQPAGRGGRLRVRRPRHLPGAARVPRGGRRRLHPVRALRDRGAGARPERLGGDHPAGARGAAAACGSRSSASTCKLEDAYLSVVEALRHAGIHHDAKVDVEWIDSEAVARPCGRGAAAQLPTGS